METRSRCFHVFGKLVTPPSRTPLGKKSVSNLASSLYLLVVWPWSERTHLHLLRPGCNKKIRGNLCLAVERHFTTLWFISKSIDWLLLAVQLRGEKGSRRDYLSAVRTVIRRRDNKRPPACTRSFPPSLLGTVGGTAQEKQVNKVSASVPERQRRHVAFEEASNGSLPHAVQEYFRILIAHLVCCCHMAFISIPSTQWGVKGPDAVSSSIPHILLSFVSYQCSGCQSAHHFSDLMPCIF